MQGGRVATMATMKEGSSRDTDAACGSSSSSSRLASRRPHLTIYGPIQKQPAADFPKQTSFTIMDLTVIWHQLSVGLFVLLSVLSGRVFGHGSHSRTYTAGERPTNLHDPKVVQDAEHIKEHYEGQANINENEMTPEELEFHYFKLHDFDNNTKLDGLEIYAALTHLLPYEVTDEAQAHTAANNKGKSPDQLHAEKNDGQLKYYTDIIDSVLEEDDIDNDGYLTYIEFVLARKREEGRLEHERREEEAAAATAGTANGQDNHHHH